MALEKVASKGDLAPGQMIGVRVGGQQVLLANVGGDFYAINDICKHAGCKLHTGKLEGNTITCPCHGSQYDVTTGQFTRGPTTRSEESFRVVVEGNDILIDSEAQQASA